jgi:hypothetical protein
MLFLFLFLFFTYLRSDNWAKIIHKQILWFKLCIIHKVDSYIPFCLYFTSVTVLPVFHISHCSFVIKTMFCSSLPPVVVGGLMFYVRYLCVFGIVVSNTYCVVSLFCFSCVLCNTLCCQFLWIVQFWLPLRCSLTFI